jgi:thiol:disulfide interchange protein
MKRIILLAFCLVSVFAHAQKGETIKWSFALSSKEIHIGDTVEIVATAEIIPDWYLYSNDFDPTLGPTVTTFDFVSDKGYSLLGKTKAIKPKKKFDPIWEGEVTYFTGHAEFRQKIVVQNNAPKIVLMVEYQTCSDAAGRCIPGEAEFEFMGLTVLPAKKATKTSAVEPTTEPSSAKNPEQVNTNKPETIQRLEAEKARLTQRDAAGNDVSVDYLKSFVKKYSK